MIQPLIYLDYPLDIDTLIKEAQTAKENAQAYGNDPRIPGETLDNWLISRHTCDYIEQIIRDFEVNGKPRFYWLAANAYLLKHTDHNTTCSINFVLSDEAAPITIEDTDYYYTQALLNTTKMHSVQNGPKDRLILKISIFDESFENLANRIKYKNDRY
jgi:hypothetical protein